MTERPSPQFQAWSLRGIREGRKLKGRHMTIDTAIELLKDNGE